MAVVSDKLFAKVVNAVRPLSLGKRGIIRRPSTVHSVSVFGPNNLK